MDRVDDPEDSPMSTSGEFRTTRLQQGPRRVRPGPSLPSLTLSKLKAVLPLIIIASATLAETGCARVHMSVNAYRSKSLPFPEPGSDATIGIVAQTMPAEPLLTEEIRIKATTILKAKGYTVTSEDQADYILLCMASMDAGVADTGYATVTSPGRYAYSRIRGRRGRSATVTTYIPGRTTYLPYTYTVYTKGLVLTCLKKDLVRDPADSEESEAAEEATVWRCVTLSAGSDSDLRWIVNHMLLTAFDVFGMDTGQQRKVSMDTNDNRVLRLAEDGVYEPID